MLYYERVKYSIVEFRKHPRRILDEAMRHPVIITRYDEEFVLAKAPSSKVMEAIAPIEEEPPVMPDKPPEPVEEAAYAPPEETA